MQVATNTVVALAYRLTSDDENGERIPIEETTAEAPMAILFGVDELPAQFDTNLRGKSAGDAFSFTVPAEENPYGAYDEDMIVQMPKDTFRIEGSIEEGLLTPGNMIPMQDEGGNQLMGQVIEEQGDDVVIDFNHPLAGIELQFEGTIVNVREASAQELEHGHAHGAMHDHGHDGHEGEHGLVLPDSKN